MCNNLQCIKNGAAAYLKTIRLSLDSNDQIIAITCHGTCCIAPVYRLQAFSKVARSYAALLYLHVR